MAVLADLQRGVPHEVRTKALRALGALPGHRLEAALAEGKVLERLVRALSVLVLLFFFTVWLPCAAGCGLLRAVAFCAAACTCASCSCAAPRVLSPSFLPPSRTHPAPALPARPPAVTQVLSLRSTDDTVRAAAIEAAAELTGRERTLALAAEQPGALSALIDLWEGVTDALTGALWAGSGAGNLSGAGCCALGCGVAAACNPLPAAGKPAGDAR